MTPRASALTLVAAFGVSLVTGSLLTGLASCDSAASYVYSARRWDPSGHCLAPYAALEVVNGTGEGSFCPSVCLVLGSATYVSTMCPPFPTVAAEGTADAGDCVGALEAAQLDISCEGVSVDDSGATASEERVDAAGEAEAANREDAASDRDATADASDGAVRKPDAQ